MEATASRIAAACDVIVVMVPDLPDLAEVILGREGLLAGAQGRTVVVVSSTVSPDGLRDLASRAADRSGGDVVLIDAPVSGGEEGARRRLSPSWWVVRTAMSPAFGLSCRPWAPPGTSGSIGAGQIAKACNQIIVAANLVAVGEAAVLAERSGLNVADLFGLLQHGLASSRVLETKGERIAAKDYGEPSGRVRFITKDLGFAVAEAERTGMVAPHLRCLYSMFTELVGQGYGDMDTSAIGPSSKHRAARRAHACTTIGRAPRRTSTRGTPIANDAVQGAETAMFATLGIHREIQLITGAS